MLNLTPIESRIVRAIVAGASNRRAALELNLSESAVNKVLAAAYKRNGFTDRTQLAIALVRETPTNRASA